MNEKRIKIANELKESAKLFAHADAEQVEYINNHFVGIDEKVVNPVYLEEYEIILSKSKEAELRFKKALEAYFTQKSN